MKRDLLILLLFCSTARAEWATELKDVQIPMQDGKSLAADVYLPPAPGKYPAVLVQTPYNKANMGAVMAPDAKVGETGRGSASDMKVLMDRDHYAYVIVDWRGFYGSKAAMAGVKKVGFRRGLDGFDCVEWIAGQDWSNGRVGTWGGSALGKQQLDTAAENPPHLVCCVPLIAAQGQWYGSYYEGGVMLEGHVKRLDQLGFGVGEGVKESPFSGARWTAIERFTYKPAAIRVPCLFVTGWWDNYPDRIIRNFEDVVAQGGDKAKAGSKLLIGPWDHVSIGVAEQGDRTFAGAALESGHAAKAFLDFWLRDAKDNGWDKVARVRYWACNEDGWKDADAWSAIPRKARTLFFAAGDVLTFDEQAPLADRAFRIDPADPVPTLGGANLPPMKHGPTDHSPLDARKDVVKWTTAALAEPLRLNGNAELTISFSADTPDFDFCVRLCHVTPEGRAFHIADTARRASLRESTEAKKLLEKDATCSITLKFPVTAYTIPKDHKLRVYLSGTDSPRYERNTGTGADHWDPKAAITTKVTVFPDGTELRIPEVAK